MGINLKCPTCGADVNFEEVDIRVGILTGNYHCPQCGWEPEKLELKVKE